MKKIGIIILAVFLVTIISCSRNNNDQIRCLEKIVSITDSVCFQLDIKATTSIEQRENKITFLIHFIDHYPLMDESHKVFNSFLLYKLDSLITRFDTIEIARTYEDLVGLYSEIYLKEQVFEIQRKTSESVLFRDMVIYAFIHLNNYEIIGFEDNIEDLRELIPDKFMHKGSFWLLIYNYSFSCCDTSSISYNSMHLLRKSSHYPERPWRPEVIDYLINYCESHCE